MLRWTPEVVVTIVVRLGGLIGVIMLSPQALVAPRMLGFDDEAILLFLVLAAAAGVSGYCFLSGKWVIRKVLAGLWEVGRCRKCGYDLTGIERGKRCPECGALRG